jgi:prevent-host-death family protein
MQATAKDLRFHSKELLDTVSRGEEVVITYRGKPCAKLVPIRKELKKDGREERSLFGIWKDHDSVKDVDGHVRSMRKGRNVCS